MPSLIYIAENSSNVSYPVGKTSFSIGSNGDLSLQLHGRQVSPEHASITLEDGQFLLRDLGSESGTYLNGDRVSSVPLKHNDIIRVGEYRFRFDMLDTGEIVVKPSNAETSRIDLPPELARRATQGLPDMRRVNEMRPQSLKTAKTSQIEPAGISKIKSAVTADPSGGKQPVVRIRVSSPGSVSAGSEAEVHPEIVALPKHFPPWLWFFIGAISAGLLTAIFMHWLHYGRLF